MRRWIVIWFFILILPGLAQASTLKIGISLSLTGKYAQMGTLQEKGFLLWQQEINRRGGILGEKVEMVILDDESSPEKARAIYENHIQKTKVDLIIGPYSSAISAAVLPVVEAHQYPMLLSGASADHLWEKGYQYAFGVYTPASKYTVGFLQMLVKHKLTNIAIVSADDSFSTTLAENTQKWAKRLNLKVNFFKVFKKSSQDLSPLALELKTMGPDVIIVCGHLDESVHMVQSLKKAGWYPKAYYASVGPATDEFHGILGLDADLAFSSSQWEKQVSSKYPFGEAFVQLFVDTYQQEPSYHAATAYAAGMILEIALNQVGSLDREKLRDTLSQMDTMTLIGRYGVDKFGKQRRHFPLIIQWQQGEKKIVWPEEIKTADPVFK